MSSEELMLTSNSNNETHYWYQLITKNESPCLKLTGDFTLAALESKYDLLSSELSHHRKTNPNIHWDLIDIQQMDMASVIMLWQVWQSQRPTNLHIRPEHEIMFKRLENIPAQPPNPGRTHYAWFITTIGNNTLLLWEHLIGLISLIGQLLLDIVYLIKNPTYIPWREISSNLYRTGAQALGITALVGFLIGIVLSYLSAQQLKLFGADIFIIDLLGISIIRELGPVLAAILVAGRSGSSMTAQLGVMRVTQELDALTVMGISHSQRLVLPKIIGLGIAMPLLVLWTSAVALLGGMVAAEVQLGLNYQYFISALPDAVPIANLWLGLGKGVVCGMAIALIACHFGLRIKPNTDSLGAGTTVSVVTSITVVIIIDAIFAVVFSDVGLI